MDVNVLDKNVIEQLRSSICINSVSQCATELVFNSLDAKSTAIAVRVSISNFRIQVTDNGTGISRQNLDRVGLQYMTSKCHTLSDLRKRIKFYGFRGEALSSICKISKVVTITTREEASNETYCKYLTNNVEKIEQVEHRASCGTTVTVQGFLDYLPVRQRCIKKNELDHLRGSLESIALIFPKVVLSLRNDVTGKIILQTQRSDDIMSVFKNLHPTIDGNKFKLIKCTRSRTVVEGLVHKEFHANKKLQYLYVNRRPVLCSKIHNVICSLLSNIISHDTGNKAYPVYVIHIKCPHSEVDYQLNPSKTMVAFKKSETVIHCIKKAICSKFAEGNLNKVKKVTQNVADSQFGLSEVKGAVRVGVKRKARSIKTISEKSLKVVSFPPDVPLLLHEKLQYTRNSTEKQNRVKVLDNTDQQDKLTNVQNTREGVFDLTTPEKGEIIDVRSIRETFLSDEQSGKNVIMEKFIESIPMYSTENHAQSLIHLRGTDQSSLSDEVLEHGLLSIIENKIHCNDLNQQLSLLPGGEEMHSKNRIIRRMTQHLHDLPPNISHSNIHERRSSKVQIICENESQGETQKAKRMVSIGVQTTPNVPDTRCEIENRNCLPKRSLKKYVSDYNFDFSDLNKVPAFNFQNTELNERLEDASKCCYQTKKIFDFENHNQQRMSRLLTKDKILALPKEVTSNRFIDVITLSRLQLSPIPKVTQTLRVVKKHKTTLPLQNTQESPYFSQNCLKYKQEIATMKHLQENPVCQFTFLPNREPKYTVTSQQIKVNFTNTETANEKFRVPEYPYGNEICQVPTLSYGDLDSVGMTPYRCRQPKTSHNVTFSKFFRSPETQKENDIIIDQSDTVQKISTQYQTISGNITIHEESECNNKSTMAIQNTPDIFSAPLQNLTDDPVRNDRIETENEKLQGSPLLFSAPINTNNTTNTFSTEKFFFGSGMPQTRDTQIVVTLSETEKQKVIDRDQKNLRDFFRKDFAEQSATFTSTDFLNTNQSSFCGGKTVSKIIRKLNVEESEEKLNHLTKEAFESNIIPNLNSHSDNWIKNVDDSGNVTYTNRKSGLKISHSPKSDISFNMLKRPDFLPKGFSPIMVENGTVEELSPTSKKNLQNAIVKSYEDELLLIKWENCINGEDPVKFFEDMYLEKSKLIEASIPNINKSYLQKNVMKAHEGKSFTKEIFQVLEIIGQVDCKFIAALDKTTQLLLLFDQHAVHERVRVEMLFKEYKKSPTAINQKIVLFLPNSDLILVRYHKTYLKSLGISFDLFTNGITIDQLPLCIVNKHKRSGVNLSTLGSTLIKEIIESIKFNDGASTNQPKIIQNIINSEACRGKKKQQGAIKFGDNLRNNECRQHLQDLSQCKLPFQCAHGRPTLCSLIYLNDKPYIEELSKPNLRNLLKLF